MSARCIYDYPLYYDILFGWDRSVEADFYESALRRGGVPGGARVLEVACGTGQISRRLASRGYQAVGLDASAEMLAFLRAEADLETIQADMTRFEVERPFSAAINPMSSFRLLHEDAAAEAHLRAVAAALEPGGIYVLDLDFLFREDEPVLTTGEPWTMSRGGVTVHATDAGIRVEDHGRVLELSWGTEGHLRGYTPAAFGSRVEASGGLRIETWHPESGHHEVSHFDAVGRPDPPAGGRCMVFLRRA